MEMNNSQLNHASRLFIYGNFGNDPGAAKRSVKVGSVALNVTAWTPKIIICNIVSQGPTSSGEVLVTAEGKTSSKLLNEWTVDFYYAKKESPNDALTRKIKFVFRFRGDAIGYGKGTDPLLLYTELYKVSKAVINMPEGSYSNGVTLDACGDYKVQWGAIIDHVTDRSFYAAGKGLGGRVFQTATGFGVEIKFSTPGILRSTRTFTPCTGSVTQQLVNEEIHFDGFHEETIWFPFATQAARTFIKAGSSPIQTGTGAAPGLFWDVQDLNILQFNTKTWWEDSAPKYD